MTGSSPNMGKSGAFTSQQQASQQPQASGAQAKVPIGQSSSSKPTPSGSSSAPSTPANRASNQPFNIQAFTENLENFITCCQEMRTGRLQEPIAKLTGVLENTRRAFDSFQNTFDRFATAIQKLLENLGRVTQEIDQALKNSGQLINQARSFLNEEQITQFRQALQFLQPFSEPYKKLSSDFEQLRSDLQPERMVDRAIQMERKLAEKLQASKARGVMVDTVQRIDTFIYNWGKKANADRDKVQELLGIIKEELHNGLKVMGLERTPVNENDYFDRDKHVIYDDSPPEIPSNASRIKEVICHGWIFDGEVIKKAVVVVYRQQPDEHESQG